MPESALLAHGKEIWTPGHAEETSDESDNHAALVQFLVGRDRLRYEFVVNYVDKDRIRGYVSTPKDKVLSAEGPRL